MRIPEKLHLANLPTPLHEISFEGSKFLIKRDDFTGLEFSGNKIRKLDYLIWEALKKKSEYIFTCGGDQSNHARATTVAAISRGLKPVLFLWGKDDSNAEGNLFIDKFLGADIKYLNRSEYDNVNVIMHLEKKKYENKGRKVYVIPEGGSNTLGIWGYINFISELKKQYDIKKINKIFVAAGSGGTAAGLLLGVLLNKLKTRIYAVNVLYSEQEIRHKIINLAEACNLEFDMNLNVDERILEVVDGYSEEGYKRILPEKIKLIKRFAGSTGIILDPAYTGKAFNAFYDLIIKNREKGALFIHTGGLYGAFDKRKQYLNP